jgi:guanylate kinase
MFRRGLLIVISGPSGSGKTTVARQFLERPEGANHLERSVSVTTRPPRPGELNGSDYEFVSEDRFAEMLRQGELLEHAEVYGQQYGTPRAFVESRLEQGIDVVLVLDPDGRRQLAERHEADLVSIFLLPPPRDELERRLRSRGRDEEDTMTRRLAATQGEIARAAEYDHVLVNRDVQSTVASLITILETERSRRSGRIPGRGSQHTPKSNSSKDRPPVADVC